MRPNLARNPPWRNAAGPSPDRDVGWLRGRDENDPAILSHCPVHPRQLGEVPDQTVQSVAWGVCQLVIGGEVTPVRGVVFPQDLEELLDRSIKTTRRTTLDATRSASYRRLLAIQGASIVGRPTARLTVPVRWSGRAGRGPQ
jgi:hypothetical protein